LAQNGAGVTPLVMNWMPSVEISFLRCNKATSWLCHLDPNHGLASPCTWACCQIKSCGKRHMEMKKENAHSPHPDTHFNRIQFTGLASVLCTNKIFSRVLFLWDWVNRERRVHVETWVFMESGKKFVWKLTACRPTLWQYIT
jgi:hypothetical protein